jgi:hypothetical protein
MTVYTEEAVTIGKMDLKAMTLSGSLTIMTVLLLITTISFQVG